MELTRDDVYWLLRRSSWATAIIGTTWFLSHLCTELFLLLALIKVFGKRRAWLVGAAFGFAMLSRAISAKKLKTSFRLSS